MTRDSIAAALLDALPDSAPPEGAARRHRNRLADSLAARRRARAVERAGAAAMVCAAAIAVGLQLGGDVDRHGAPDSAAAVSAAKEIGSRHRGAQSTPADGWCRHGGPQPCRRPVDGQSEPRANTADNSSAGGTAAFVEIAAGVRVLSANPADVRVEADSARSTRVRVARGHALFQVEPRPDRPVIVRAGSTSITVIGTTFSAGIDGAERATVTVYEGRLRVESAGRSVELAAGESYRDPPPADRSAPDRPPAETPPIPAKALAARGRAAPAVDPFRRARRLERSGKLDAARAAYRRLIETGPRAEDALYALARIEPDPALYNLYRERYPDGRYARAIDVHILRASIAAGDHDRVLEESNKFLRDHPDDPRADQFRLARATVEANRGHCPAARRDAENLPPSAITRAILRACP